MCEEVYDQYYDSVGNYKYTGTVTGEHTIMINSFGLGGGYQPTGDGYNAPIITPNTGSGMQSN